jgi:hypothetical protein
LGILFEHKQSNCNRGIKLLVRFLNVKDPWEAGISFDTKGVLEGDFVTVNRAGHRRTFRSGEMGLQIGAGFHSNSIEQLVLEPITNGKRLVVIVCEEPRFLHRMQGRKSALESLGFAFIVLTTMGTMTRSQCQILRQLFARKDELGVLVFVIMSASLMERTIKLIYDESNFQPYIVPLKKESRKRFLPTSEGAYFEQKALKQMARPQGHFLSTSCPPGDLEDRCKAIHEVSRQAIGCFLFSLFILSSNCRWRDVPNHCR